MTCHLTEALARIITARDEIAEGGDAPFGPDQAFDDWAADVASEALAANELTVMDADDTFVYLGRVGTSSWEAKVRVDELEQHLERAGLEFGLEDSATDMQVTGKVEMIGGQLFLSLDGYGAAGMTNGPPVLVVDLFDGLTVQVWADINQEDYTHRIDLKRALESNWDENVDQPIVIHYFPEEPSWPTSAKRELWQEKVCIWPFATLVDGRLLLQTFATLVDGRLLIADTGMIGQTFLSLDATAPGLEDAEAYRQWHKAAIDQGWDGNFLCSSSCDFPDEYGAPEGWTLIGFLEPLLNAKEPS